MSRTDQEDGNTYEHTDTCCEECRSPSILNLQRCSKEITNECADVDAHVEDVVAIILLVLVLRSGVHIPQQRGYVRLEESVTNDHQRHRHIQHGKTVYRHETVSRTHHQSSHDDRLPVTEISVGKQTSKEWSQEHESDEGAIQIG